MKIVVTGVAGFIGSFLAEKLIDTGHHVTGIDNFNGYYTPTIKRINIRNFLYSKSFTLLEQNLLTDDTSMFADYDYIFHLAGQPGVRSSWGSDFQGYVDHNILVTQKILESIKESSTLKRFVFASSSSVYGNARELPLRETTVLSPVSPYGVTKLTAEHLCSVYSGTFGLPIVCLRFFTVYGPRQRPDMAFHRFFRARLMQKDITVFGDGSQTRDFTFVDDIVTGAMSAAFSPLNSRFTIFNLGSGRRISLKKVIDIIGGITGEPLRISYTPFEKGDMSDTLADISQAVSQLGYTPGVDLVDGLKAEWAWICEHRETILGENSTR